MYETIYQELKREGRVTVLTVLDGSYAGAKLICCRENYISDRKVPMEFWQEWIPRLSGETRLITEGKETLFEEVFQENSRLVICGGGHVSQPVSKIAKILGFHVTVLDDRAEFACTQRFPEADEIMCGEFEALLDQVPAYPHTFYVAVTRGHEKDAQCAGKILKRPHAYLGMIGSRAKVKKTREQLLSEGISAQLADSIYSPIGIPLGGQLPEEIAVSIMAEIVKVKNEKYISCADQDVARAVLEKKKGVMVTIVKKTGSSPRGTGSKMFVDADGHSYGSIGGGNVEYAALKRASSVSGPLLEEYSLSAEESKNLGMVCGGNVQVFFEIVGEK